MPVSRVQLDFDQLKVRLHTTTLVVEFWFWPTFTTTITIFFRVHRTTLVVGVDLTSTIVPSIRAICGAEANNLWILVKSLSKSKCPLQIISYAWVSKLFPEANSNYTQHRANERKIQPSQLLMVGLGQVRVVVVVVVINGPFFPPYPSKNWATGSKLQPPTTDTSGLCVILHLEKENNDYACWYRLLG